MLVHKRPTPAGGGGRRSKEVAEPVSLSSITRADFPLWPCGLFVQPSRVTSTYSRSVLGASGNLEGCKGSCKRLWKVPAAICELFNYQHFHSTSCSLWKVSQDRRRSVGAKPLEGRLRGRRRRPGRTRGRPVRRRPR